MEFFSTNSPFLLAKIAESAYSVIKERYNDKSAEWETKVLKTEKVSEEQYLRETEGGASDA